MFSFIITLVPNYSEAEDLLQETASLMWQKFDTFEPGTNFWAWARQIARYKISNYYRTKKQEFRLDEDLLDHLCAANEKVTQNLHERRAALTGCLKKLNPEDSKLIHRKYFQKESIADIARQTDRSLPTLYKQMSFIYFLLQSCIRKTLLAWGLES